MSETEYYEYQWFFSSRGLKRTFNADDVVREILNDIGLAGWDVYQHEAEIHCPDHCEHSVVRVRSWGKRKRVSTDQPNKFTAETIRSNIKKNTLEHPTTTCGAKQHSKFMTHWRSNYSGRSGEDYKKFCLDYADMLEKEDK